MIIVLGMCSSGTTALAKSLRAAGLDFGEVRENVCENRSISLLHARMTYWKDPHVVAPTDRDRRERDEILQSFRGQAFKEPLTLFTLPLWQEALAPKFVGTFRHPAIVAERFMARYGGTRARWEALWCRYNARLLALHADTPFPLVSFDREDGVYGARLREIARALGLRDASDFDSGQRHESEHGVASEEALSLYAKLRDRETSWAVA